MKLKALGVLALGSVMLTACQTPPKMENAKHAMEQAPVPGSIEDFNKNVPNTVYFAFDSSTLNERSERDLLKVCDWLKKYPHMSVVIEGHADERGTGEYNLALGERRAVAAKDFLAANGVGFKMRGRDHTSDRHVRTVSYGKDRLPAGPAGDDEYTHQKNRVSIVKVE